MKFVGTVLQANRASDEEHVELVRRQLKRSGSATTLSLLSAGMALLMFLVLAGIVSDPDLIRPGIVKEAPPGMCVGLMLGAVMGLQIVFALACVENAVNSWRGRRTERLMLKYHDQVHPPRVESSNSSQAVAEAPEAPAPPPAG